ncbi:MAG: 2-C-methyl-D-erythritol 2,4-cyclodiphosphate synthase [Planctomycetota bacterium]|jgi:2-C-methyl-D-erythritol 2,4-cyclodiphosphate synthase
MQHGRVGLGVDAHPVEAGRPCRIGGVEIDCPVGPVGHSDGDPLLHALTDALLGALGAGDIGQYFPDSAEEHAGVDSAVFVEHAMEKLRDEGFRVVNLDAVVQCDRPTLAPHRDAICANLAELCNITPGLVNVKGKTLQAWPDNARNAIHAQVIVLLAPITDASVFSDDE